MLEHSTPGLVARAMASNLTNLPRGDEFRTRMSEYIIKTHKPNLLLIHLIELDGAHHRHGPRSQAALEVAEQMDSFVGRIVEAARQAGIFDKTAFIIVSDHGFAEVNKIFEPNVVLVKGGLIRLGEGDRPASWRAVAWNAGGSSAIMLRDPNDREAASKVADIFRRMASGQNSPINRVLSRGELDRLGAFPGAELALDAAPGYYFGDALTGPEVHASDGGVRGTHGQLPTRAELRASLIMFGQGVRAGTRISLARMIDIAPTAASLLGLRLSKPEGRPIFDLVEGRSR
jgi:predicted AlkP superfamily pyrophosphatase or phosphodiesterase